MKYKTDHRPLGDLAWGNVFVLLAVVAISYIQPPKKDETPPITPKAEYLLTLTWQDGSPVDLDIYLKSPTGDIVFFKNKDSAAAFLNRDNTGRNNSVPMPDGTTQDVPTREEVITIRAIIPGEWVCNVHDYSHQAPDGYVAHAKVTIVRLNPYSVITEASLDFDAAGEEKTVANFVLASDGHVSDLFVSPVQMAGQP